MRQEELVIGVDIGGTKTSIGCVDRQGRILSRGTIPTNPHRPAEELFERLSAAASTLLGDCGPKHQLAGVGVGAPNANYYRGTVEHPPNLSWDVVDVVGALENRFGVPVALTNDANAAALGEMLYGSAKGLEHFIVITLGTGLGSGIVVGGELVYGADGFAGEVGHTIVDPAGRECGCGRRGCLETYVSAGGLRRTVFELMATSLEPSELRSVPFNDLSSEDISAAAGRGDRIAIAAFEQTASVLARKLADAVAHTGPEAIVLFGGLAAAGDLLLKPTQRALETSLLNVYKHKVRVMLSALPGSAAAVLGAAALSWTEIGKKHRRKPLLAF